jgi:branched-chain amino acid transport system substrate-binding protein
MKLTKLLTQLTAIGAASLFFSVGQAIAAEPIKIGYTGPLSGSLSLLGQAVRDGVATYVAVINDQGGVNGRKIEFIAEDDAYEPMRTLAAAKKLSEQDKVLALVGSAGTANVTALVGYSLERKMPIIAPYAFSNALTTPVKKYVFTTLPEVRLQTNLLGDYLLNVLKHRKIAAIYQNDDFGQDAVSGLDDRLKKNNVTLTKLPFDRGTTNFSGVVAQAKQSGAEDVVFLGIPRDAALIMKEANKMGWTPQFSGHNALGDPQTFILAGAALVEGAIAVAVMEPLDSTKPQVAEFLAHQKKFMPKTTPTTYSLHGYNAGRLFVEAVKKIQGEPTGEKLVAAMESIKDFNTGLMGPLSFNENNHAGSQSVSFMRAKNSKWAIVTEWLQAK